MTRVHTVGWVTCPDGGRVAPRQDVRPARSEPGGRRELSKVLPCHTLRQPGNPPVTLDPTLPRALALAAP